MLIFPIVLISFVAGLTRYITKTWISPGAFFAFCWSFFVIVPTIFATDYKIDHLALWFITIFTMAIATGSIVAYSKNSVKSIYTKCALSDTNYKFHLYVLIFFTFISFFGIYSLFLYATNIYGSINYENNWMIIPNMIAIDRYSGGLDYPSIITYSLYFIYPASLLAGLLFGSLEKSKKTKGFLITPLIAAILLGMIEGARSSILLSLVLFFSAWLSTLRFKQKFLVLKRPLLKITFQFGSILILFIIFFVVIQWLRQGMDTIIFELLIDRIRAYFFGYLAAFSKWFVGMEYFNLNVDFGLITFAGPFNLIGVMERPLGFYQPVNITTGISTNIFTAFRGIITDFSILGAIIIAFITGFAAQIIFQKNDQKTLFSTVPVSMFYAFTLYSPLISIFHYNSILFSWFILLMVLKFANYDSVDSHS